ncbi:MAG TPA: CHAP domain-containing protein [Anaeromyxobacter sp.]|nr:CHAP domain-containing protein [Anaeromyxobacter sp.]
MRRAPPLALLALLGAACATARGPAAPPGAPGGDLAARLAGRAEADLGQRGPFTVGDQRFAADCSGFAAAVYEAEGVPLRRLMARAAPGERSGVAAAYQAAKAYGVVFGGGGEWPRPGDLVFFRDTYDRNHDGAVDDPFTHMGVVERVEGGTVTFLHRGGRAVTRGVLTRERPAEAKDEEGRVLNTALRDKRPRIAGAPSLAGQLFMAYGRIDPRRIPPRP